MPDPTLLTGRVLRVLDNPFDAPPEDALKIEDKWGLLIEAGRISDLGPAEQMRMAYPVATEIAYGSDLICPGFIDAHVHFPQTAIIASWGKRLIDWLNSYTFPEEIRFGDPAYAAEIAARYFDLVTAHGTTTVCSFCTIHPASVDAFFAEAQARNMRVVGGKTCMDRNAPEGLQDTAQTAYDDSKALLAKWHGVDRLSYAITPRFSPTSTPDQLQAMGALWAENPDCLMQTHLSEQTDEIAWVKSLFPEARDYLDTYEAHGLLGENGLYGHAIHLEPRERDRLREVGAALVHCPTSNTFIGSGLFDMNGLMAEGHRIGSSFSMLRTMAAAYEIGQLRGTPLHAAQLIWLATAGSATALKLDRRVGTLARGMEADLCVLDLSSTPAIAQRTARAEDSWEELFATIMMGDDRAVRATWVNGKVV